MKAQLVTILALALALGSLVNAVNKLPRKPARPRPAETEEAAASLLETFTLRGIAKRRITGDAAAGRLSLLQAAALFGALNRVPPASQPGVAEAEGLCRQVIAYAEAALEGTDHEA